MKQNLFSRIAALSALMLAINTITFAQITTPASSPEAEVTQRIGVTDITIHYNRPYVKERKIWGELVPYGFNDFGFGTSKSAPWRAGADYNTTIEFTDDVKLEGKAVEAGKYGLFMALEENGEVTIILSSNTTSWGSYFYEEKEDVVRFKVTSKELETSTEMLTYEFNMVDANSAVASLRWEKKEIPFKIEVDVEAIVLAGIKNDLRNPKGFTQDTWDEAAGYALSIGNTDLALEWINKSIEGEFFSKETFSNLSLKSQILQEMGKKEEASKILDQAIPLGTARELYGVGITLMNNGDLDKAQSVMEQAVKDHDGAFPTNYGLARIYSAQKNNKKAIKSIKNSMEVAPAGFKTRLTKIVERLEKGEDINQPVQ